MKIKLPLVLTLLLCTSIFSQTEKGKLFISGSSGFVFTNQTTKLKVNGDSSEQLKTTNITVAPAIGYLVVDNLAIGLELPYSLIEENNGSSRFLNSQFAIGPFVKYYFPTSGTIKPFLGTGLGIGAATSTKEYANFSVQSTVEEKFKNSLFTYNFNGGVAIFISNAIGLEFGIGYLNTAQKPKENNSRGAKLITSGIAATIGFSIFL